MSIEQQLKNFIVEHYGSAKAFASAIGMPNSTLDNIFRRGILNSSVGNVIMICDGLNISCDALCAGSIVYREPSFFERYSPTPHEVDLAKQYFDLDERGKSAVCSTIEREHMESTRSASIAADAAATVRGLDTVLSENHPAGAKK